MSQRNRRGRTVLRGDWRYSVAAMWDNMKHRDSVQHDMLIEEMRELAVLKEQISQESKKNYALGKENQILDQKIGLLVKNRISLEEAEAATGDYNALSKSRKLPDETKRKHYENLFYLLAHDPQYMSSLAYEARMADIDNLLHAIMFTLYGNQYEAHDEHMLLILFEMVLTSVYDDAKELGSLMRANTAITRMMTTYTRRGPGQDYLKNLLSNLLTTVTSDDKLQLEVNPLKVYDQMINDFETSTGEKSEMKRGLPYEEIIQNEQVKSILEERIPKLKGIANEFLDAIIESCESIPYGIRWICKQISILTQNKFPSATNEERYRLMGGFYLLRFVNPSIVTPHSFLLLASKPGPIARRNLTYIAKVIQNMSNFLRFEKEPHMGPMNSFIDENRERMCKFFEKLIDVEDPRDFLEMDEYNEMARTSVPQLNISINEIVLIHTMLYKQLDQLKESDNEDPLVVILSELGDPPAPVPRSENGTVELTLVNRFDSIEDKGDQKIIATQRYSETKALLFNLYRAVPILIDMESPSLLTALDKARSEFSSVSLTPAGFEGNVVELVDLVCMNLRLLSEAGLVSESDNFERLRKEVKQELENMNDKLARLLSQKKNLKEVMDRIKQHTTYLLQTHETFLAYLENVRSKAYKSKETSGKKQGGSGKKFTYSHIELEKKGIVIDSEVPPERKSYVFFTFSSGMPGIFTISVMYKGQGRKKDLGDVDLKLDDLLEQQDRGDLEYETDYVTLSVNMLVHLLKKSFFK